MDVRWKALSMSFGRNQFCRLKIGERIIKRNQSVVVSTLFFGQMFVDEMKGSRLCRSNFFLAEWFSTKRHRNENNLAYR